MQFIPGQAGWLAGLILGRHYIVGYSVHSWPHVIRVVEKTAGGSGWPDRFGCACSGLQCGGLRQEPWKALGPCPGRPLPFKVAAR